MWLLQKTTSSPQCVGRFNLSVRRKDGSKPQFCRIISNFSALSHANHKPLIPFKLWLGKLSATRKIPLQAERIFSTVFVKLVAFSGWSFTVRRIKLAPKPHTRNCKPSGIKKLREKQSSARISLCRPITRSGRNEPLLSDSNPPSA